MVELETPIDDGLIAGLSVGDVIRLSGTVYCGRDAVLPKVCETIGRGEPPCDFRGGVMFHTAVSPAGIGPTSSNKVEIEESIGPLSAAGIKVHLGKGALSPRTAACLAECNSVYAVIPPVTALLGSKVAGTEIIAFPELGMEALHRITVDGFEAIVAVAQGKSIYEK